MKKVIDEGMCRGNPHTHSFDVENSITVRVSSPGVFPTARPYSVVAKEHLRKYAMQKRMVVRRYHFSIPPAAR